MNQEPPPLPVPAGISSCQLHPDQLVTGFCASCLRDRLAGLKHASNHRNTSTFQPPSVLKDALKPLSSSSASVSQCPKPQLRRSKSFSVVRADGILTNVEPQRKSCDVRSRSTLCSLFHQDDAIKIEEGNGTTHTQVQRLLSPRNATAQGFHDVDEETKEKVEEKGDSEGGGGGRLMEAEDKVEESATGADGGDWKTTKDHIDLDRTTERTAGNFWFAASALSKKLQKWRRKTKVRKSSRELDDPLAAHDEKTASSFGRFHDTQSEVADYGCGRRSFDSDPRFSLDAGRMSFDEPRASWDGYLSGRPAVAFPRMSSSLIGPVVENSSSMVIHREDHQIPLEAPILPDPTTSTVPGGSLLQTREHNYLDSSSSLHPRPQNLDRSSSSTNRREGILPGNKGGANKCICNTRKISPATIDYSHVAADGKDSSSCCDSNFGDAAVLSGKGSRRKKSGRWIKAWNVWGLIKWRGSSKLADDEERCRCTRGNVVGRSYSESWPELSREANAGAFSLNSKVLRSNSSASWRGSSSSSNDAFRWVTRPEKEAYAYAYSKRRRQGSILERNRSAKFSPHHFEHGGLLRFYLTPRTTGRNNGGASRKSRSNNPQALAG